MNPVEELRLANREVHKTSANDLEAGILELGEDLANEVALNAVGLDDREGAFNCHEIH